MVKPKVPSHTSNPKKDAFFRKPKQTFSPSDSFFLKPSEKKLIKKEVPKKKIFNDNKLDRFFAKPSEATSSEQEVCTKKPFDKNKCRQNKYSLKNKVDKWKNKHVSHIRHEYLKQKNRSKLGNFDVQKVYEEEEKRQQEELLVSGPSNVDNEIRIETCEVEPSKRKNRRQWKEAKSLEEKEQLRKEFLQRKLEKEKALEKYRKKKIEKHKKLNMKTKKGQPIMKGRMELLLEQIQEKMGS